MLSEYVSKAEAARLLGCTKYLLNQRIHEYNIPTWSDPIDKRKSLILRADLAVLTRPGAQISRRHQTIDVKSEVISDEDAPGAPETPHRS